MIILRYQLNTMKIRFQLNILSESLQEDLELKDNENTVSLYNHVYNQIVNLEKNYRKIC